MVDGAFDRSSDLQFGHKPAGSVACSSILPYLKWMQRNGIIGRFLILQDMLM